MKIHILSAEKAREHIPLKRTYAIRIYSGNNKGEGIYGNLVESDNYVHIREYFFDDTEEEQGEPEEGTGEDEYPITRRIAREILANFRDNRNSIEELMIHCREGKRRSRSVAIALNNIFNLGEDSAEIRRGNPTINELVYRTMMEVSADFKK